MANKKMIVSISVGVGVMLLTYLALQDSLKSTFTESITNLLTDRSLNNTQTRKLNAE